MQFIVVSTFDGGAWLAQALEQEGNHVTWLFLEPEKEQELIPGQNIFSHVYKGPGKRIAAEVLAGAIEKLIVEKDVTVVFALGSSKKVKTGAAADILRKKGIACIGASSIQDKLENDRAFAMELIEANGIAAPQTESFTDFNKGMEFAREHPEMLVYKPDGEHGSASTIISDDHDEFISSLEQQERYAKDVKSFILQERVPGVEISLEGWFDGKKWVENSWNSTFEEKKFLNENLGPNTPCTGNVVFFWLEQNDFFNRTLGRLTEWLKQQGVPMMIDFNTIGGQFLEFTPRFGYDASLTLLVPLLNAPFGKMLHDVSRGQSKSWNPSEELAGALRLSIPPWPHEPNDLFKQTNRKAVVLPEEALGDWFWFSDMARDEENRLVCTGYSGTLGIILATGERSVKGLDQIEKTLYMKAKEVKAQDLQYRTDVISYRMKDEIPPLLDGDLSGTEPTKKEKSRKRLVKDD